MKAITVTIQTVSITMALASLARKEGCSAGACISDCFQGSGPVESTSGTDSARMA